MKKIASLLIVTGLVTLIGIQTTKATARQDRQENRFSIRVERVNLKAGLRNISLRNGRGTVSLAEREQRNLREERLAKKGDRRERVEREQVATRELRLRELRSNGRSEKGTWDLV